MKREVSLIGLSEVLLLFLLVGMVAGIGLVDGEDRFVYVFGAGAACLALSGCRRVRRLRAEAAGAPSDGLDAIRRIDHRVRALLLAVVLLAALVGLVLVDGRPRALLAFTAIACAGGLLNLARLQRRERRAGGDDAG